MFCVCLYFIDNSFQLSKVSFALIATKDILSDCKKSAFKSSFDVKSVLESDCDGEGSARYAKKFYIKEKAFET